MSHVEVRNDADRLPWLNDTPAPAGAARFAWREVLLLVLIGILGVALLSYIAGKIGYVEQELPTAKPEVTVRLPRIVAAQVEQKLEPKVEHELAPPPARTRPAVAAAPQVLRIETSMIDRVPAALPAAEPMTEGSAAPEATPATEIAAAAPTPVPLPQPPLSNPELWPAAISSGAEGRVARIGTFATRHKAKVAWTRVVRLYPGVRRLRAVVAPVTSLRNNRTYYRLQFGTTSQAHSEVLCQRMRIIGQSCVVVGV